MLIGLSGGIMFIMTLFSIIFQATNTISFSLVQTADYLNDVQGFNFLLDDFYFAIGIIIALAFISILIGFSIFGSGISGTSVKFIITVLGYVAIWVFLTVFSLALIFNIVYFGVIIYIALTFMYMYGIFNKYSGSG